MKSIQWQDWSDGVFERSRKEEKPVFLWIEYFGCAACSKMENEAFSDSDTIDLLNTKYIPVRISREDRPDINRHFQRVFTTMTGKDEGWPLSVFVDADRVPLYTASYLPTQAQDGMMGLAQVADLVAKRYEQERSVLLDKGNEVLAQLAPKQSVNATKIDTESLRKIFSKQLEETYDETNHGLGKGAKYLHIAALQTALTCCTAGNRYATIDIATETIDAILDSHTWDERFGGFYCCSLDETWSMPQKKKDLSQNGLMISVLLKLGEMHDEDRYLNAASKIGEWALSHMQDPSSRLFYHGDVDGVVDTNIYASTNAIMAKALAQLALVNDRFRPDAMEVLNILMSSIVHGSDIRHKLGEDIGVTFLMDYATMAEALLSANALTDNDNFSLSASEIANAAIRRFYNNGFWGVSDGQFTDDTVPFIDTNLPSPASTMAMVLGKLSKSVDSSYAQFANQTFAVSSYDLMRKPVTKAKMTEAVLLYYGDSSYLSE